jgi:PIN domain nuclease of toxin-antitoxin system
VARLILDASVVIAFLDPGDASHEAAVSALSASTGPRTIPASVLAEVLVHPYREGAAAARQVERVVAALATDVAPLTEEIARAAARLRARHARLRLPDALVLATGEALGAEVLTADRALGAVSSRVRVI